MPKTWIIARHEFSINVRRPGFIISTLAVPILGILGLVVATFFGNQTSSFLEQQFVGRPDKPIGVVDESGIFSPPLPDFENEFRPFAGFDAGRLALQEGEIDSLVVIPPDYVQSGKVKVVIGDTSFQAAALEDSGRMNRFLVTHLLRDSVPPDIRSRVADPIEPVLITLDEDQGGSSSVSGMVFGILLPYFLGVLLMMTIFLSANYLLRGVVEEKSSRIIEIILSSVTARELLAGKVLGLGALGLLQVFVWLVSAAAIGGGAVMAFGAVIPLLSRWDVFALCLVYYLLGYTMYAVLMGSVGTLGTDMRESQQLAGFFSITAFVPLMLGGVLFSNPNSSVARMLSWFPLTAPTMMMLRLPLGQVPPIDIVGSIATLILTIPFILWAGAKVFRMGLLMVGRRPSLRQVWAVLRQA